MKNNDDIVKLKSKDFIDVNTKEVLKVLAMKLRRLGRDIPYEIEPSALSDLADLFNSAVAIELFSSLILKGRSF